MFLNLGKNPTWLEVEKRKTLYTTSKCFEGPCCVNVDKNTISVGVRVREFNVYVFVPD